MGAPSNDGVAEATLADLGEWELIRRLGAFAPAGAFDDDAALLDGFMEEAAEEGARQGARQGAPQREATGLVVNTDVLVEGVHFSEATTAAADVGWRAAAVVASLKCTPSTSTSVFTTKPVAS
ncbi:MAG: hypothetical protein ACKOPS_03610, partial [Cyanobium sp.]